MKKDVIIIGGGIVGCAAAYYLAKKGLQVTVFEKNPGVGLEASGRNAGGVRQHGRKAALPLAIAGVRMWSGLAQELGSELEYVRTGNLNVAVDEKALADFEKELDWEHEHGLEESRMLTARECEEMVPGLAKKPLAGKFCATDGLANPMLVTPAFARAATKLGVDFRLDTPVTSLLQQGSRVCGVKTGSGELEAEIVINTAGPWASLFSAQCGCPMPISPGNSLLLVTERLLNNPVKMWISVRGQGYMRPTVSGNLVLGTGGARNDDFTQKVDFRRASLQAEHWSQAFPWLKEVKIIRAFAGITEYTPDHEPYIGPVPGVEGLFVAAGFSGEGFCPGPLVGKILTELIAGGEPEVNLEPFKPDRFAVGMRAGIAPPQVKYPWDKMCLNS